MLSTLPSFPPSQRPPSIQPCNKLLGCPVVRAARPTFSAGTAAAHSRTPSSIDPTSPPSRQLLGHQANEAIKVQAAKPRAERQETRFRQISRQPTYPDVPPTQPEASFQPHGFVRQHRLVGRTTSTPASSISCRAVDIEGSLPPPLQLPGQGSTGCAARAWLRSFSQLSALGSGHRSGPSTQNVRWWSLGWTTWTLWMTSELTFRLFGPPVSDRVLLWAKLPYGLAPSSSPSLLGAQWLFSPFILLSRQRQVYPCLFCRLLTLQIFHSRVFHRANFQGCPSAKQRQW